MEKTTMIKCPKCGREFFPSEIYIAESLLGNARRVLRDDDGTILDWDGSDMDLTEEYECDCGCKFKVTAKIEFVTEPIEDEFDEDSVTKVNI